MKVQRERFTDLVKGAGVVGLPSGMSVSELPAFLDAVEEVEFEFYSKGQTIARAYWREGFSSLTASWSAGGCISIIDPEVITRWRKEK